MAEEAIKVRLFFFVAGPLTTRIRYSAHVRGIYLSLRSNQKMTGIAGSMASKIGVFLVNYGGDIDAPLISSELRGKNKM